MMNRAETLINKVIGRTMTLSHYYPETKREYDLWINDTEAFGRFIRKSYHHAISSGMTVNTVTGEYNDQTI